MNRTVQQSAVTLTLTELETVSDRATVEEEEEEGDNPLSWVNTVA
jgi:hypothetical protein